MFKKIIESGGILLFLCRILKAGSAFSSVFFGISIYGVSGFGELSYYYALLNILSVIAAFGTVSFLHEVHKVNSVYTINALSGVRVFFAIVIFPFVFLLLSSQWSLIVSIGLLFTVFQVYEEKVLYDRKVEVFLLISVVVYAALFLLKLAAFFVYQLEKPIFFLFFVADMALPSFIYWVLVRRDLPFTFNFSLLKRLIPLTVSSMLIVAYSRVDQIMLKTLSSDYELGLYSLAARFSEFLYLFPVAMISYSYAQVYMNDGYKFEDNRPFFKKIIRMNMIFCFITYVVFYFGCEMVFGKGTQGSADILLILIANGFFILGSVLITKELISNKKEGYLLARSLLAVLINIILNYFFIPAFGGVGAAIASAISQFFVLSFSILSYQKVSRNKISAVSWL